jgi:hypothetical protein
VKVGDLVRALGGFRKGEIGVVAKITSPVPLGTSGPVQKAHVFYFRSQELVHHLSYNKAFEVINESR